MRNLVAASAHVPTPEIDMTDGQFDHFAVAVATDFTRFGTQQLFQTDADGDKLFQLYLDSLPLAQRQHHTCNCCRAFFRRYAGLVFIDDAGKTTSAMWDARHAPSLYTAAANQLRLAVERATVTASFFSSEREFGNARTGFWTHFAVTNQDVFKPTTLTADEQIALKREHFGTIARALDQFPAALTEKAVVLLSSEALWRSEKVLGGAQFLNDLHKTLKGVRSQSRKRNLIWAAIARAPAGFCTPRSGMIGTLLEDLAAGKSIETVKLNFAAKMALDKYRRPTAATSAGNIASGEKLIERMGLAVSLKRRFASVREATLLWAPRRLTKAKPVATGVFAGLDPRVTQRPGSGGTMTWEKFARTILPTAAKISLMVREGGGQPFSAIVTEAVPGSPKLFQWDGPLSSYVYVGGSSPHNWNVRAGLVPLTGVAAKPGSELAHNAKAVILLLDGARDMRSPGLALFPENLRSELHPIRKTMEQFSARGRVAAGAAPYAAGYALSSNMAPVSLVVETAAGSMTYTIDRFD
jgi:hypothetical protein